MQDKIFDFVVIGGGAVGLSTAYKLMLQFPDSQILVLEKETQVAAHQTGHNSGVIHSGLYYKPGSKKALNCFNGREQLVLFAQENNIKHEVCGKIVAAATEDELPRLEKIYQTGLQNGLTQIKMIDGKTAKEIEPFCNTIQSIWVPYTGIIDFPGVCRKLAELLQNNKNQVLFNQKITKIQKNSDQTYTLVTNQSKFKTKYFIACAGLHSDRIAKLEGLNLKMRIVGFRGDYYDLTHEAEHKVKSLIYPVPNPQFPFLGVHFTRMALGGIECGPNAVFTFKREGYGKTDFSFKDTFEALTYKGTLKFMAKHWRFGLEEYRRAFSKSLFLKQLQRLLPDLKLSDLKPGRSGVRAMALDANGNMIDDFAYEVTEGSIHVLNAPSPAATACLAIADDIVQLAKNSWNI